MQIQAYLVKAFTKDKNQGNPAGVVLNANTLSDKQMLHVAAEIGFSESAFVQSAHDADFLVRFFTPKQEVDLCGHATIATFHMLFEQGVIKLGGQDSATKTQKTKAGLLPVTIHKDGRIVMTQNDPVFLESVADRKEVAVLLGLNEFDLVKEYPVQAVSTGVPKLMIPIKSRGRLFAIKPNLRGISQYCKEKSIRGFYAFTQDTMSKDADFHARQFNPLAGVNEDPITGVAAGALGAYTVKYKVSPKRTFIVEQGYIMNKAGEISVTIDDDVQVGGFAVTYDSRDIDLN